VQSDQELEPIIILGEEEERQMLDRKVGLNKNIYSEMARGPTQVDEMLKTTLPNFVKTYGKGNNQGSMGSRLNARTNTSDLQMMEPMYEL
jgi:hypothetical protein